MKAPMLTSFAGPRGGASVLGAARRATVIALHLPLLLFVRLRELRAAEWAEFDFDSALWRILAGRMKMGDAHVVPPTGAQSSK